MLRVFCNIFGEKIQKRLKNRVHFSVVGAGQYNLSIRLKVEERSGFCRVFREAGRSGR
jgi:hypothetical protein